MIQLLVFTEASDIMNSLDDYHSGGGDARITRVMHLVGAYFFGVVWRDDPIRVVCFGYSQVDLLHRGPVSGIHVWLLRELPSKHITSWIPEILFFYMVAHRQMWVNTLDSLRILDPSARCTQNARFSLPHWNDVLPWDQAFSGEIECGNM